MELKDRFLKYVSFDTQSDESSETFPSTAKQRVLLDYLAEEMKALGLTEVTVDKYGYAMGTIPATPGCEKAPVIGFIAHVDTAPDMSGADVKPHVIENYDGKDIRLNAGVTMKVADFPELSFFKGHTLIHTDGTTLLGADDKAGVAEIMTAAEYLLAHPELRHGKIRIGFTPDEEIGRGVDFFDVKAFGADFAYTMDGGFEGELEYENFNAASAKIEIQGRNVHPGYAKNKMINAIEVACELNAMLPAAERPQYTEGYEGFFHLQEIHGGVEKATMEYIIRDHSMERFRQRVAAMDAPQGEHCHLHRVHPAGDDLLHHHDHLGGSQHGVRCILRLRAMSPSAGDGEVEQVHGSCYGPDVEPHLSCPVSVRQHMHSIDRVHMGVFQHAFFHKLLGAAR